MKSFYKTFVKIVMKNNFFEVVVKHRKEIHELENNLRFFA